MKYNDTVFYYTVNIFIIFENWMKWTEGSGPKKWAVSHQENTHARQHISGDSSKGGSKLALSEDFDNQISMEKQKHTEFSTPWEAKTCWAYSCLKFKANSRLILYKKISSRHGWAWQTVESNSKCYCIPYVFVRKTVTVSLKPCRTQMHIYYIWHIFL